MDRAISRAWRRSRAAQTQRWCGRFLSEKTRNLLSGSDGIALGTGTLWSGRNGVFIEIAIKRYVTSSADLALILRFDEAAAP